MIDWLSRSRKTLVALVAGVLGWLQTAYVPDGTVSRAEWVGLAVIVAMALGVYAVTNAGTAADDLAKDAKQGGYTYQDGENGPTTATASSSGGLGLGESTPGSSMAQAPDQVYGGGHSGSL
jgi:hypothetical protein